MRRDVEQVLREAEIFLDQQFGSRAAREATKRKAKRTFGEVLRRLRRAVLVFVGLVVALILADVFGATIGFFTWLIAIPVLLLLAMLTLFWGTRRKEGFEAVRTPGSPLQLDRVAAEREEWLLERCRALPRPAFPAVDTILTQLQHMQPALSRLEPASPLAGETERLIDQHLPRLVDSWLDLPERERGPESESTKRLTGSLDIIADELTRLSGDVANQRGLGFDTQTRFIESRYKGEGI